MRIMRIEYIVNAEVVDIASDSPKAGDIFLVDSNVWYWMTYTRASEGGPLPNPPRIISYPNYVQKALDAGSVIYFSSLSLFEIAHLIEKTEREIYEKRHDTQIKPKIYRHNFPEERSRVVSEVEAAWEQITSLAVPLTEALDEDIRPKALLRFKKEKIDGYDLLILECMKKNEVVQIITDDGDFSTVFNIKVFTANRSVLTAAQKQRKLIKR